MRESSKVFFRGSSFIGGGILEGMLRKALDMGISLHRCPFPAEGNLECGGGGSYTGDFDGCMKEGCSGGASLCEGFHVVDLDGELLHWGPQKIRMFSKA